MSVEQQAHLIHAVNTWNTQLVALTKELVALAKQSGEQTARITDLTIEMKKWSVIVRWLTVAAALFGAIQATYVLVHLYRWWRGSKDKHTWLWLTARMGVGWPRPAEIAPCGCGTQPLVS